MNALTIALMTASISMLSSCKKEQTEPYTKPKSTSENKIMILGASRVEGNTPIHESFRYELWKLLKNSSLTFDFIGTKTDPCSYPLSNSESFDPDHEGHGGWSARDINKNIDTWISSTGAPDLILFSSPGGNDALSNLDYSGTISAINSIIDKLQHANPNISILIERLAPGHPNTMKGNLDSYFSKLETDLPKIAKDQSDSLSTVSIIDMQTGFSIDYLADQVHYNNEGASFIARKYFDKLKPILKN